MHPSVLAVWLTSPEVPPPSQEAWVAQRSEIFQTVREGAWWGTITSEPGSGGDMAKTKATARPAGSDGPLSDHRPEAVGERFRDNLLYDHDGSPEGETTPDLFFLDMRGVPWDGTAGVTLTAPWDGHGMVATQSHAMAFANFPGQRSAHPGNLLKRIEATG
jgi:alkylation response protein AidB-like acyl-CoA dehydrogenase